MCTSNSALRSSTLDAAPRSTSYVQRSIGSTTAVSVCKVLRDKPCTWCLKANYQRQCMRPTDGRTGLKKSRKRSDYERAQALTLLRIRDWKNDKKW
ncbi:BQ5605_C041g11976 [Microbotryum silenes-dioicae]|uniref:BQ5605_C041g11976 protein n=1 Tax=Microbotryum silenes-dioicae TaxID=796604 RepID=A0A2X0MU55_9BASI|nr:BQ5605_C041g11976 [Microbotryum silenes-dioicae]